MTFQVEMRVVNAVVELEIGKILLFNDRLLSLL